MTVWSDYVGYARFGVSLFAIVTYFFHALPFHWLIFTGLHVAMTALRIVLAVVLIVKTLFATL